MKRLLTTISVFLFIAFQIYGQNVTRGPYLQSLAPERIKILWRTDVPTNAIVWYGLSVDNLSDSFFVADVKKDHIVELTGLSPLTTYYYEVGYEGTRLKGGDLIHHFTTSPVAGASVPIKFWAIGDFGSKRQTQIDVRNSFFNHTNIEEVDFWLWLGDNAYDDGKDTEFQEKVFSDDFGYNALLPFLPFYAVPGNHDYNSVNRFDPPKNHYGPYFNIVEVPKNGEAGGTPSNTELYYSFDYGNAHFVAINSEAFSYTFTKNTEMSRWLEKDLQETDRDWKIVLWHQPPYSKGSHDSDDFFEIFMTAMRTNFNPIVEKYGVDLVLCGHSHVYERSYLIKDHFGNSNSFNASKNIVQGGNGNFDDGEHYIKYLEGDSADIGTVYVVVGNSGKDEDSPEFGHPAFAYEHGGSGACGSLIIDIYENRLDATYLKSDGDVGEEFTIIKPDWRPDTVSINPPVAYDTLVNTTKNTALSICPLFNDSSSALKDSISNISCGPTNGNALIELNDSCITYTPDTSFIGMDEICYVVCNQKGGCDTAKISIEVISATPILQQELVDQFSIHPNPTNSDFTLTFRLLDEGFIRIELLSQMGEVIKELLNNNLLRGNYEFTFNDELEDIANGIYIVRISSKNKRLTSKKMLKIE